MEDVKAIVREGSKKAEAAAQATLDMTRDAVHLVGAKGSAS
jgi:hypothetical protein